MRMNEPLQYLAVKGIDPRSTAVCCMPGCDNRYPVVNGVAYPGTRGDEQVNIFFFCSDECFLKGINIEVLPKC